MPWALLCAPVFAIAGFAMYKMTKFCDSCGKMLDNRGWSKMNFCPRCGAKLP